MIKYVDLSLQHKAIKSELLEAISSVIDSGHFILGQNVSAFEQEFADYCGTDYAIGVNSGTDALILSLIAAGIGPGDEVITVPNSFIATTLAILHTGAKPVFVDVCDDFNIDVSKIEPAITERTKVILPVHLTGACADMSTLNEIANQFNLKVIEDAAQSVGAIHKERRSGSFGDFAAFSLHPLKTLHACGDGGVITCKETESYESLLRLRNLGIENRNLTIDCGFNSRLDSIQAAILSVKMKYIDQWLDQRQFNARIYRDQLSDIEELVLPVEHSFNRNAYHTFMIRCIDRNDLKNFLLSSGIKTSIHYPTPIHLQPVCESLNYKKGDFPVCEKQAETVLSLPVHQNLDEDEIQNICKKIREYYKV